VLAKENEIEPARFQLGGERLCDGEAVEWNRVGLELDGAIRAHAHRLAQRLLHIVRPERENDDFAGAGLFLHLERDFDRVAREVVHVELDTCFIDRAAGCADTKARLGVGRALDTDGDLHWKALIPVAAWPRMRVCTSCVPS